MAAITAHFIGVKGHCRHYSLSLLVDLSQKGVLPLDSSHVGRSRTDAPPALRPGRALEDSSWLTFEARSLTVRVRPLDDIRRNIWSFRVRESRAASGSQ